MSGSTYVYEEIMGQDWAPHLARLRTSEPVCRVTLPTGEQAWLVTRYDDVATVLTDPRFSREQRHAGSSRGSNAMMPDELVVATDRTLQMDGQPHTSLRRLVAKAFTPRRVEELRPSIRATTDRLLDELAAQGPPADLVAGLASPLPVEVICHLLGLPLEDRDRFRRWSDATLSVTALGSGDSGNAWQSLMDYFTEVIRSKREQPGDDLVSGLIAARDQEDRLTETEMLFLAMGVLIGGNETTVHAIGLAMWRLFQHPDQLDALRNDPTLIPAAVEELLRYQPIGSVGRRRFATEDLELGGASIQEGDVVMLAIRSANRDETRFADAERFDVSRGRCPHLSFGQGAHFCLGATLARVELQEALAGIITRFPTLRLAVAVDEVPWTEGTMVTGLARLPVTW